MSDGIEACGVCGHRGKSVRLQTVKALLTDAALRRIEATTAYRFCAHAACDVVYFGETGEPFRTWDVRVPVWQKEPPGARLLCYCFGESESTIRAELAERGRTEVVRRIQDHIRAERCACEIRNPRGTCCLGDIIAAVTSLDASSSAHDQEHAWRPHAATASAKSRPGPACPSKRCATTKSAAC